MRILDEYDQRALLALTEAGEHAAYFKQLLKQECYGINTPITPLYIEDVSASGKIIMNEEVFLMLCEIRDINYERNAEIPFFLFGYEDVDGVIYFHTAEYHAGDLEQFEAGFKSLTNGIDNAILDYIEQDKDPRIKRPVRCYGHTHPPRGGGDRFSFADLSCIIEHELLNKYFASGAIGSLDVLINPAGDVNFIKYERGTKPACFLKYRYVYVQAEDGSLHRLAAYERGMYQPYPIK